MNKTTLSVASILLATLSTSSAFALGKNSVAAVMVKALRKHNTKVI